MTGFLDRNLTALAPRDPPLAARLREAAPLPMTLDGDPVAEGRSFAATRALDRTDAYLLAGFGLGYPAIEIARRLHPNRWLAVLEPNDGFLRSAFERVDLSELLARDRLRFFVGSSRFEFLEWFRRFLNETQVVDVTLMTYGPSSKISPEFHTGLEIEIQVALNRQRVEIRTLVQYAEQMESNVIENLAWTVRSAGVTAFRGLARGPAVVVGSGPSLVEDLDAIRDVFGHAIIITVGKSLRLLLDRGIVPSFVASLDLGEASRTCFEDFAIPPEVTLLWDPDSFPGIVAGFPGDHVTYDAPSPLNVWGRSFWGEKGEMEKGLSVAHTAFSFARLLGADPIVLSGLDLAFPGERTHAEGVTMTWGGPVDANNPHLIQIPSVAGGTVRSTQAFLSFVTAFEVEIARTRARVIHTSPAGALIRGTVHSTFPRDLSGAIPSFREALAAPRPFDRAGFSSASDRVLRTADAVVERAESGLRALRQAAKLDRTNRLDDEEFRKLATRINSFRTGIEAEKEFAPLMQRLLSREALEMHELTRQYHATPDLRARTRIDIRRMECFFQGYARSAQFFKGRFSPARQALLQ